MMAMENEEDDDGVDDDGAMEDIDGWLLLLGPSLLLLDGWVVEGEDGSTEGRGRGWSVGSDSGPGDDGGGVDDKDKQYDDAESGDDGGRLAPFTITVVDGNAVGSKYVTDLCLLVKFKNK